MFTLKNNKARNTEIEVYKGKAHLSKTILRKGRVSWIELVVCLPTLDMMDMDGYGDFIKRTGEISKLTQENQLEIIESSSWANLGEGNCR